MSSVPIFGGSTWMGICYGPYHQEVSVPWANYTKANVQADMAIIKKYYSFLRTYAASVANQWVAECAHAEGLQMAMGADIKAGNASATNAEIDLALSQATQYPDTVKVLVIGNEVDLPSNGYNVPEVKAAFNYAVQQKKKYANLANLPLSICLTGGGAVADGWEQLLPLIKSNNDEGYRHVFLTIYPYYGGATADNIAEQMNWSYTDGGIKGSIDAGLNVIIAEIGWPSAGNPPLTSWANQVTNYGVTCPWIKGGNPQGLSYLTFWFEMFDEPWKTAEGAQGPNFGWYGSGLNPQPKNGSGDPAIPVCP